MPHTEHTSIFRKIIRSPIRAILFLLALLVPCFASAQTITSLSITPNPAAGGGTITGTVTLSANAATGGFVVSLSSNLPAVASVPANFTIGAGTKTGTFAVTATPQTGNQIAVITASGNGSSQNFTLTIAPPTAGSVTLSPATLLGGASSTATFTLTGTATSGGVTASLSSSNAAATVPGSVTVPGRIDFDDLHSFHCGSRGKRNRRYFRQGWHDIGGGQPSDRGPNGHWSYS